MTSEKDFQGLLDRISAEDVKAQIDIAPVVPETSAKQKNDATAGSRDFEFRPLTEEEKEEFVNSLNAQGKQIYAELAPKAKSFMGLWALISLTIAHGVPSSLARVSTNNGDQQRCGNTNPEHRGTDEINRSSVRTLQSPSRNGGNYQILVANGQDRNSPNFFGATRSLGMVTPVSQDFLNGMILILVPSLFLCAFLVWWASR